MFDRFWKAYPRKQAKGHAERAFEKAAKATDPETIIAACAKFRWPEDKQFIPQPATWLNARRWEDEQPEQSSSGPVDPENTWKHRAKTYAQMLEKGLSLGQSASDQDVRRMVREGIITREMAEKRGYSLWT